MFDLDDPRVLQIPPFRAMGTPVELIRAVRIAEQDSSRPYTNCNMLSTRWRS